MTVGEVLSLSATLAGKDGLSVDFKNNDVDLSDEEVGKFFDAYNLTISELNEEVEPLRTSETVFSANGTINYSDLGKRALEVIAVEKDGRTVAFRSLADRLETAAGEVTITYVYAPEKAVKTTEECAYDDKILSLRIIAKAVAAEFLLAIGLFEEAVVLRSAFEDAVTARALKKKRAKIKRRVWA